MTYTPEQLQAMRDWVALNVMKYTLDIDDYDNHWYYDEDGNGDAVEEFAPDEDANQMLMALDTFKAGCLIMKRHDEVKVAIFTGKELIPDAVIRKDGNLGLAALVAMCRASGMPE